MPHLIELHNKYKDKGLVIIGVHSKNGSEKAAKFVKDQKIPYAVALDSEGKTVKSFAVDSYPDYYVIDKAGNLRVADLANSALDKTIEVLLAEKE